MDETLSIGSGASIGSDSGTAATATADQTTATEQAGSETNGTEGGEGQPSTDSGQQQAGQGRKRWSIQDEVKELRAQRRELRQRDSEWGERFNSVQEELRLMREAQAAQRQTGPAKTPANFFADPEARLQALRDELKEVVAEQNRGLMNAFHETREQEYARQEHLQKSASAAEFIRSQQGYDPSDEEDLVEIINEIPKRTRDNSDPQMIAEYAWFKLNQTRGVGNKGLQKRQAAGVQGQPPGVGFGKKNWNKSEFDQAVDLVEKNPHDPKMTELFNELMAAHKEGRVK